MNSNIKFVALHYPYSVRDALMIRNSISDEEKQYIIDNKVEKLYLTNVIDTDFLLDCNCIRYLSYLLPINPEGMITAKLQGLLSLQSLKLLEFVELDDEIKVPYQIEMTNYHQLEYFKGNFLRVRNLEQCILLKTLRLRNINQSNLLVLSNLRELDTLEIIESKILNLDGIETKEKLQCLYLHYNRKLQDISKLAHVKRSLKTLVIENCAKIKDFSVLNELENLEHLKLIGSNNLSDLSFLKNLKNLKTFIISMNVLNGDLSLCLDIPYVFIQKGRKHYNYSDKHMRKEKEEYRRGNENLPEWRRLY